MTLTTLKYDDLKAILKKQNVPNVVDGAAYVSGNKTVQFQNKSKSISFRARRPAMSDVENADGCQRKIFHERRRNELLLGLRCSDRVSPMIFSDQTIDPIGKRIKIGDQSFEVIGVLAKPRIVRFFQSGYGYFYAASHGAENDARN